MDHFKIHFFGGVEVYRDGALLAPFPSQKALSLFAYLVLRRGRLVHRDTVCGQFWGEHSDAEARKSLRMCLWRIRSVLEPAAHERGQLLRVEGSQIGLAAGGAWADAWEFEDCLQPRQDRADGASEAERLERAVRLYRGDLLEGVFDEWCLLQRDRLRLSYLTALERLVGHHARRGHWLEVIAWGQQVLREDPLREHMHRAVMEGHFAMGDRPSAMRQFDVCRVVLRQELGIEPMEETRVLHARIRGGAGEGPPGRAGPDGLGVLAAEVDGALAALYDLTDRLETVRLALDRDVPRTAALASLWPRAARDVRRAGGEPQSGRV